MGFWHTGYLDMMDLGPPGVITMPPGPKPTPSYRCFECATKFKNPEQLRRHVYQGHESPAPSLYFRGLECGRTTIRVSDRPRSEDWVVPVGDTAVVNGEEVDPFDLPELLATFRQRTVKLTLSVGEVSAAYRFDFSVASPDDLDGVDHELSLLAESRRLDRRSIDSFVRSCEPFASARRYVSGLVDYFYGVLAREGSPDSGLARDEYRHKYNPAVQTLSGFDRGPAHMVRALVAFHYNQYAEVLAGVAGERLRGTARRLAICLSGQQPDYERIVGSDADLERLLSDAETERMLRWACLPLGEAPDRDLESMRGSLPKSSALDVMKLRVLLAEHALAADRVDEAREHANASRHNPDLATWAASMLRRADEGPGRHG